MSESAPGTYINPLIALIKDLQPKTGLEIGFGWFGFSAKAYLENCDGTLTSIDKEDWRGEAAKLAENPRFTFVKQRSENLLKNWKKEYDYIYVDGDHRFEGALQDMKLVAPLVKIGGVVVLDDCDYDLTAGVDLNDSGSVYDGQFGVGRAADEVFENDSWERVEPPIPLANGGRVYRRIK